MPPMSRQRPASSTCRVMWPHRVASAEHGPARHTGASTAPARHASSRPGRVARWQRPRGVSYNFRFRRARSRSGMAGAGPAELSRSSAPVAQLVEQRIRNAKVGGSTPSWGTKQKPAWRATRRSCSNSETQFAKPEAGRRQRRAAGESGGWLSATLPRQTFRRRPAPWASPTCPGAACRRAGGARPGDFRFEEPASSCWRPEGLLACPNASAHPRARIVTTQAPHESAADTSLGTFRRSEAASLQQAACRAAFR